jgi:PAS domain-containing protein
MYLGLVRDLRERKLVEESLALAMDAAHLGTWDWDLRSGRIVWGGHHAELWGLAPEAFEGSYEAFIERIHPDDRELVAARVGGARRSRQEYQCEYRVDAGSRASRL